MAKKKTSWTNLSVQLIVWSLYDSRVTVEENRWKQPDLFDSIIFSLDLNSITHVEGVFYEKEDDTGQNLLTSSTDEPGETCMEEWLIETRQTLEEGTYPRMKLQRL